MIRGLLLAGSGGRWEMVSGRGDRVEGWESGGGWEERRLTGGGGWGGSTFSSSSRVHVAGLPAEIPIRSNKQLIDLATFDVADDNENIHIDVYIFLASMTVSNSATYSSYA